MSYLFCKKRNHPESTWIYPAKFEIEIKNAKSGYFLTLSQLYDTGWSLETNDGGKIGRGPFIANIFENTWLIERQGDYNLVLEYGPQKKLQTNIKISAAAFIGM